ncbi:MAG: hypothetical protein QXU97_03175 [Fervidicoccaceae archaeon]
MRRGREIVERLRRELEPLNAAIIDHPYLREAESGALPLEKVKRFAVNQLYIIPHDMRSIAHMLHRAEHPDEQSLFKGALDGDYAALAELRRLAAELGVSEAEEPDPEAVAYTHYLAWLSLYANPGEAAVALVVNLPVWGRAVSRLGSALERIYGIKETGLFKLFSVDYAPFEEAAYPVIERYEAVGRYSLVAKMIQRYEKMFWDAIYR